MPKTKLSILYESGRSPIREHEIGMGMGLFNYEGGSRAEIMKEQYS